MPSMRSITRSTTRLIQHLMCADLLRQPAASTRRRPTWLPKQETPLASAQLRPCGRRATCSSQRASDSEWQVVVVTNRVVRHPGDEQLLDTPNGEKIADSKDVIKVVEDEHPARFYIPRQDVRMDALERTQHTSQCPFKGAAHYYSVKVGGRTADNAVWTYEDPYDELRDLKGRLAFYDDKVDEIKVLAA